MYCTQLAENTVRKKSPKNYYLDTIAQLFGAVSLQLTHLSTIGKNLLNSSISSTCPHSMMNLWPTNGWDLLASLGYPCRFQQVSRLAALLHSILVLGVSQTLQRWTEGATYIWQGSHHVGHWPTFLV